MWKNDGVVTITKVGLLRIKIFSGNCKKTVCIFRKKGLKIPTQPKLILAHPIFVYYKPIRAERKREIEREREREGECKNGELIM